MTNHRTICNKAEIGVPMFATSEASSLYSCNNIRGLVMTV